MDLTGSSTLANLEAAFASASQASLRYSWFAQKADIEGLPEAAALFRAVADAETGQAHGHLEFLAQAADPVTGEPIGETSDNYTSALAGATYAYTQMYPDFAKTARQEGFEDVAEWFETVDRSQKSHAGRFRQGRESLE